MAAPQTGRRQDFQFNKVLGPRSTQEEVFREVEDCVTSVRPPSPRSSPSSSPLSESLSAAFEALPRPSRPVQPTNGLCCPSGARWIQCVRLRLWPDRSWQNFYHGRWVRDRTADAHDTLVVIISLPSAARSRYLNLICCRSRRQEHLWTRVCSGEPWCHLQVQFHSISNCCPLFLDLL